MNAGTVDTRCATSAWRRQTMALLLGVIAAGSVGAAGGACPSNADLRARDLLGAWRAQIAGEDSPAALVLEPNPDWPDSLAGRISRNGRTARLAGDLEDGTFTLEESADGVRIDATWIGQPLVGSCGHEIRGSWQAGSQAHRRDFVLRRVTGW